MKSIKLNKSIFNFNLIQRHISTKISILLDSTDNVKLLKNALIGLNFKSIDSINSNLLVNSQNISIEIFEDEYISWTRRKLNLPYFSLIMEVNLNNNEEKINKSSLTHSYNIKNLNFSLLKTLLFHSNPNFTPIIKANPIINNDIKNLINNNNNIIESIQEIVVPYSGIANNDIIDALLNAGATTKRSHPNIYFLNSIAFRLLPTNGCCLVMKTNNNNNASSLLKSLYNIKTGKIGSSGSSSGHLQLLILPTVEMDYFDIRFTETNTISSFYCEGNNVLLDGTIKELQNANVLGHNDENDNNSSISDSKVFYLIYI
jgi:hypothetical protein